MAKSVKIKDDHYRLIGLYLLLVAVAVVWLFCGCATERSTESSIQMHRMALMTEKMDSMLRYSQTWQQSIYEKQQSLVDSFKQSEVRDTSHTIFLGAKGDTVKEVITIYEERVIEHTKSETSQEWREELFRQTDSLFSVNKKLEEKMDSMLYSRQETSVVKEKPSIGDKLKWFAGGVILSIIGFIACCTSFMKKK